jgi:hypothetical protein
MRVDTSVPTTPTSAPGTWATFALQVVPSHHPAAELARRIEREVFLEFFGNTAEMLAAEYDPYEASSLFLLVTDERRRVPAGAMRVILPSAAGPKSLHDLARVWRTADPAPVDHGILPLNPDRVWDIATLAVSRPYRGGTKGGVVSLALYQALAVLLQRHDVESFMAILDVAVLELLQTQLGRPFTRFEGVEPQRYLDSPWSLPVYCDVKDYADRLRFAEPSVYEIVFEAKGLEAAVSFPSWDTDVSLGAALAAVS